MLNLTKIILFICSSGIMALCMTGCTFNFELTSQRTALENQVLGSYKEIEDELILLSPVRGVSNQDSKSLSDGAKAKMNQDFNRDDIEELKSAKILGESLDGEVVILGSNAGKHVPTHQHYNQKLIQDLVREENDNRRVIWKQIISNNPNLSFKDLDDVKRSYAKLIYEKSAPGHLIQSENKTWISK